MKRWSPIKSAFRVTKIMVWSALALMIAPMMMTGCGGSAPEATGEPRKQSHTPEQVASAKAVLDGVRKLATLEDRGNALDVRFGYGVLPGLERERVHQLITAIADADAVLSGRARRITFYDPTGKNIGAADPLWGIKLSD